MLVAGLLKSNVATGWLKPDASERRSKLEKQRISFQRRDKEDQGVKTSLYESQDLTELSQCR